MLLVGLTGGLASGKSFLGHVFEECGGRLIRLDDLGHDVLAPGGPAYPGVLDAFGSDILKEDRNIDRKRLGALVFGDPARLARLNELVHPHVYALQEEKIAAVRAADPRAIVVVEAAIMIETGSYQRYEVIVLALCARETQVARAMRRDSLTREEVEARLARQMPLEEKAAFVHFVVNTDHTKEETALLARKVFASLRAMEQSKHAADTGVSDIV